MACFQFKAITNHETNKDIIKYTFAMRQHLSMLFVTICMRINANNFWK